MSGLFRLVLFCGAAALTAIPASAEATRIPTADQNEKEQSVQAETFLLRYKFGEDEIVRYRTVHDTEMTTRHKEFSETNKNRAEQTKHFRIITSDRDGNAHVEFMIERVIMKVEFPGNPTIEYDSKSDNQPPRQFRQLHQIVNLPHARGKFSPRGELLEVLPLKQSTSIPVQQQESLGFLVTFPEEAIAVGDHWDEWSTLSVIAGGSKSLRREVRIRKRYTLQKVDDGIATLKLHSAILPLLQDPREMAQMIQRTPSGTIKFDMNKGQIVSRSLNFGGQVINALGPKSLMTAKSTYTEELLEEQK